MLKIYQPYKKDVSEHILNDYKEPDEYVVLNEDKNLHLIHIKLPSLPDPTEIDGWGLPAHEQKFKYQEFPKRLQKLVESCTTIEEIWEKLDAEQPLYREEIRWIKNQWRAYEKGYWFFCNGKPTYIVGWHYIYLNFWRFKGGKRPDYRDRNRKFYHGLWYAYTTTDTIEYDELGVPVYSDPERKIFKTKDFGFRTFLGLAYPKHRKDGASNMCLCAEYMEIITHNGVVGGIISMTGDQCKEKLFDEIIVPGWTQMPFFFKPKTTSNKNPGSEIKFNASRSRADKLSIAELDSKISYSPTSASTIYDGGNNLWINVDESGKTIESDVFERHRQLKPCVSLGNGANIFGFLTYPSTVGEMAGEGGKKFFKVCQDSHFEKRDISGQTKSGMMVIYMPAYEGLDGFIGPYGESIIETPTKEQAEFIGRPHGAKEVLFDKRKKLLADNDMDGYNEEVRLFPTTYMECFRTEDGDIGFNTQKLNDRRDALIIVGREGLRQGNFKRIGEDPEGKVYWDDDVVSGRSVISKMLNEDETNRFYIRTIEGNSVRFPIDPKFTASADPFKFDDTSGKRQSLGGGSLFWDYDPRVDDGVDIKYWKSHRFICTYLFRLPKKYDYAEDMLMMTEWANAWMFPEIDYPLIWDYFKDRGRAGYLKHEIDRKTELPRVTPGFVSKGRKQEIFNSIRDYIEDHVHREMHMDLLDQWKNIESMDQMTDYDLVTTSGGCLIATPGVRSEIKQLKDKKQKIEQLLPKTSYASMIR